MAKMFVSVLFALSFVISPACFAIDKMTKTEADGFTWVRVTENNLCGAETVNGKNLIPLSANFDFILYESGMLKGINIDKTVYDEKQNVIKEYVGYYTTDGKCIIQPGVYDLVYLYKFEDGVPPYFKVKTDGKYGACDMNGRVVLQPVSCEILSYTIYGFEIKNVEGGYEKTGVTLPGHNPIAMCERTLKEESDGFTWTELKTRNLRYGAMDSNGVLILPLEMNRIEYKPSNVKGNAGIFVCRKDEAVGWYAQNGNAYASVELGYTYIRTADIENYLKVDKGDKEYGIYEISMGEIIPCGKYDYVSYVKGGYFSVQKNDKYGAADMYGNEIVPPLYPYLSRDENGIFYTDDNIGEVYVYTEVFPEPSEFVRKRFEEAYSATDSDVQITLYLNTLKADPKGRYGYASNCYNNIGWAYEKRGDHTAALSYYQKALEIDPENTFAQQNIARFTPPQVEEEPEQQKGWAQVLAEGLGNIASALNKKNSYNNTQYNNSTSQRYNSSTTHKTTTHSSNNRVSGAVNRQSGSRTYNNYVSQLIGMSTNPSSNNASQRRNIQSSMRSIREQHGLSKSAWEDWDGNPDHAPR